MNFYEINDYEWVAAPSLDAARAWYDAEIGEDSSAACELDDAALDHKIFIDLDGDFGPKGARYTFRQALALFTEPTLISTEF